MNFEIKKATKAQSRARIALMGPAGSGKTYSALNVARHLGQRIIVIDTERGSASKYADEFDFDVIELDSFSPKTYALALRAAEDAGADVLIIDSLSHAWIGKDGALEQVDRASGNSQGGGRGNSFTAWKNVTPLHNELVDTILRARAHVIATLRTKTEYIIEQNARGQSVPRKVGLAALQREGLEYEFDIVGVLDMDNNLQITKTRCRTLASNEVIPKPGREVADRLRAWLSDGAPPAAETEVERLRRKVRQGLENVNLSEQSKDVTERMRERYGVALIDELSEEELADFDRYIGEVADKRAKKQPGIRAAG